MGELLARSWLFEIVDSKTGKVETSFTLVLPPQRYSIVEKQRVQVTKTFGNLFVDDYGPDNLEITLEGISGMTQVFPTFKTTGNDASTDVASIRGAVTAQQGETLGYDARGAFFAFRNEIMRYKDNFESTYHEKELRVYDLWDEQGYLCILLSFALNRNADKPFFYPFTISLLAYAKLDSKEAAKPKTINIAKEPFSVLNVMDNMMGWFNKGTQGITSILNAGQSVINNMNLIRARLSTYTATVNRILASPLALARQLIDSVSGYGDTIRAAWNQGKFKIEDYATFLEAQYALYREALGLFGYALGLGPKPRSESLTTSNALTFPEEGLNTQPNLELQEYAFNALKLYTVKGNDSLQRIALVEMGSENLWPYIVAVNKDIQDNSDLVVGSQIYIPVQGTGSTKDSYIISEEALRNPYGVDIQLDSNGNLIVGEANDFSTITGISNVLQSVNVRFKTLIGSMIKQTAFGLAIQPGQPGTALALKFTRIAIRSALMQDPRIRKVENVTVGINGDKVSVAMDLYLYEYDESIPAEVVL